MRKGRNLFRDKRGIEGLPMYLIIIVVIAVAVLAAVLAMMKYITFDKPIEATCTKITGSGNVISGEGYLVRVKAKGMERVLNIDFTAEIKVYEKNTNKPISGATVTISGAGTAGSNKTDATGVAKINIKGAKLEENQEEIYMRIEVKASGYQSFVDDEGILILRVSS
ncbi:MAG: Ig-like domain-containing protein [Thermoplasmatales archaeon]|nr:Ig-like domain-containing protein [Thermoplasmatales archaeon]